MDIYMIGIDYSKAVIEYREKFTFTTAHSRSFSEKLLEQYDIEGVIVLSTCNRTEVWCSGVPEKPLLDILLNEFICETEIEQCKELFTERNGEDAVSYLMELSCGVHSQIFGEDQILTQVKQSLENARLWGCTEPVLETLFRMAVTAAKKIKTEIKLTRTDRSIPNRTADLLEEQKGSLKGKNCLIIGNGEMGRLMAEILVKRGCQVTMTLRQYKKKETIIPELCDVVLYDERIKYLEQMDIIISATLSPHYTLQHKYVEESLKKDKNYIFVDLAVPRDIEPTIGSYENVTLYDMDKLGYETEHNELQMNQVNSIIEDYKMEFCNWYNFRTCIPMVQQVCQIAGELTNGKLENVYKGLKIEQEEKSILQNQIQRATEKAVSKIMFSMREHLDQDQWGAFYTALGQAAKDSK